MLQSSSFPLDGPQSSSLISMPVKTTFGKKANFHVSFLRFGRTQLQCAKEREREREREAAAAACRVYVSKKAALRSFVWDFYIPSPNPDIGSELSRHAFRPRGGRLSAFGTHVQ